MEAIFAFVFLLVLIWCRVVIKRRRSRITNWPLLGMVPGLLSNAWRIHDYVTEQLQQSSSTLVFRGPWFSTMRFLLTSDPQNVHHVLSANFANFNKGEAFRTIFQVLGDGILVADSESWKLQRKLTHSLFRRGDFLRLVERTARRKAEDGLLELLDHAAEFGLAVDMQDFCQRFALDVTCIFLLGFDSNSLSAELPDVPLAVAIDDMEEALLYRHIKPRSLWKLQKWLRAGVEKKAARAQETIDSFIYHQLSLKRALNYSKQMMRDADGGEDFDLISSFMQEELAARCGNPTEPSDKFLRDAVLNLLSAGRDTTSTTLTWFFWLVSANPSVETKIREEIKAAFQMEDGDPWRFPSYQRLNKLPYLHAALCETLRLYPPLPYNHKASVSPDILPSGHAVREKTGVIISMYAMGRMEELWGADCREFKPERWISEKGSIAGDVPSYKLNVFGAGPRACLGREVAFMEMKTVAAAVIWSYRLRVVNGHQVLPANSLILHMQHGLKVNVVKR
uniref:Cytochrome P450 n=1 Tax=Kalanchoe fedtschenkoi TaxID=63787 RepID=A0A7N0VHZ9_KALFE